MDKQIIDISGDGITLRKTRGSMMVERPDDGGGVTKTPIPFDEIEAVIIHGRHGMYSHGFLVTMAELGIPVILCNANHMPMAWLWPMDAHFEQARRMASQLAAKDPLKKRLWSLLVREKILNQGRALSALGKRSGQFEALSKKVRSGDPDNIEGQAAARYWPLLFGEGFLRNTQQAGLNTWLNYGYAIVRARVARSITGAGLHPSLGLFHRNRYNPFCLVDDVMEPFRPLVDYLVYSMTIHRGWDVNMVPGILDLETKQDLVAILTTPIEMDHGVTEMGGAIDLLAQSLGMAFLGERKDLQLPISYPSFQNRLL